MVLFYDWAGQSIKPAFTPIHLFVNPLVCPSLPPSLHLFQSGICTSMLPYFFSLALNNYTIICVYVESLFGFLSLLIVKI